MLSSSLGDVLVVISSSLGVGLVVLDNMFAKWCLRFDVEEEDVFKVLLEFLMYFDRGSFEIVGARIFGFGV